VAAASVAWRSAAGIKQVRSNGLQEQEYVVLSEHVQYVWATAVIRKREKGRGAKRLSDH
jgi:hypothetical protein